MFEGVKYCLNIYSIIVTAFLAGRYFAKAKGREIVIYILLIPVLIYLADI